jgi:hypothetical protein
VQEQKNAPAGTRDLLAPVYGWFTEGHDTRELKEAKGLLDELLQDESLDVWLIVNDQDVRCHAVRSTRVSISFRSIVKSMGLVKRASAPLSRAFRFVSASP